VHEVNEVRQTEIHTAEPLVSEPSCLEAESTTENLKTYKSAGFKVLTAASMKMAVFWVVEPCSLVEVYQRFRGTCCLLPPSSGR
jgi:hypothetical protein